MKKPPILLSRCIGWLVLAMGLVGTLAGVSGLFGVWMLSARIQQPIDRVFNEVTNLGSRLEENARKATATIEESRTLVSDLDAELDRKMREWLEGTGISPEGINRLSLRLQVLSQRIEDWRAFSDLTGQLIEQGIQLVEDALTWLRADITSLNELRTAIDQGQAEVNSLLNLFGEVEGQLKALTDGPPVTRERSNKIDELFLKIDQALGVLMTHSTGFAEAVEQLEQEVQALQAGITRLLTRITILLTLLLIWQTAAQGCLGWCGWRLTRNS